MTQNNLTREFEMWLNVPANNRYLDKLINSIHFTMKKRGCFLRGIPPGAITKEMEQEFWEELKNECIIFLLEDESMLLQLMGRNSFGLVKKKLNQKLVDLSRSEKDIKKDTWRLFRRHILDVLRTSEQFVKKEEISGEIYYGRTPDARQAAVTDDDIQQIAYPADLPLLFADLNTKKNILKAADYFWTAVPGALKIGFTDISLPVNTFINWIGRYVDLQARVVSGESRENDQAPPGILETTPELNAFKESKYRTLTIWAQKCFNYLKDNEKYLFFYFICKEMKHDAVSKVMGKKSNMAYQKNKMIDKLRSFLRPLDWVSPDADTGAVESNDLDFFRSQLCADLDTWHAHKEKP